MNVVLASTRSDQRFALEVLLREQPGMDVVGTTTNTEGLLALTETSRPVLLILDWDLPGRPLEEVLVKAHSADCRPYVIVLGKDETTRQAALSAGADAFVLRGDSPRFLLEAIQQARSHTKTATEQQTPSSVRQATAADQTSTKSKGE
ncbi:MAG TPA: response regulator [Anaerolineae bacterium]|nr:response regulator [Anaerolineae bacterium]